MATKLSFKHLLRMPLLQQMAAALLVSVTFYLFVVDASHGNLLDFRVYFEAAERAAKGTSLYEPGYRVFARDGRPFDLRYLYPPFLALALTPFIDLPYAAVKLSWCAANYLILLCCALVTSSLLAPSLWKNLSSLERFVLALFFLSCFEPIYTGIMDGQVHLLILLCLLLFLQSVISGIEKGTRPNTTFAQSQSTRSALIGGIALSVASAVKMSPAFLGIGLILTRSWSMLRISILAFGALCGLAFVSGYFFLFADFLHSTAIVLRGDTFRSFTFNFAFDRTLLVLLSADSSLLWRLLIKSALVGTLVGLTLWLWGIRTARKSHAWSNLRAARMYAFLGASLILLSPIVWFHHLTWILPSLLVLLMHTPQEEQARLRYLTIILGLYFFISQVAQMYVIALRQYPAALTVSALTPSIGLGVVMWLIVRAELRSQ